MLFLPFFLFFLQKILCMYAFPLCHESTGLPLCYEDCMAVRHQFCFNDWAIIEDNKQRDIYIRSRGHFVLPECESLPKVNKESPTCSHVHLTDMDEEVITCKLPRCLNNAKCINELQDINWI